MKKLAVLIFLAGCGDGATDDTIEVLANDICIHLNGCDDSETIQDCQEDLIAEISTPTETCGTSMSSFIACIKGEMSCADIAVDNFMACEDEAEAFDSDCGLPPAP